MQKTPWNGIKAFIRAGARLQNGLRRIEPGNKGGWGWRAIFHSTIEVRIREQNQKREYEYYGYVALFGKAPRYSAEQTQSGVIKVPISKRKTGGPTESVWRRLGRDWHKWAHF